MVNYKRTIEIAESLPQIDQAGVDGELFEQLCTFEGIDAGEAILTTYVAQILRKEDEGEAVILTGDKRYLKALAQVALPELQALLKNRFWCLEQLILRGIREYRFETVRDKIVPVRDCDKACKVAFGSGDRATEKNVFAAMTKYIEALRAETGDLLHGYAG